MIRQTGHESKGNDQTPKSIFMFKHILPTSTITKYIKNSGENVHVDIGALRVKRVYCAAVIWVPSPSNAPKDIIPE